MITDSDPPRRNRLRVALLLSMLVHGTGAVLYGVQPAQRLFARHPFAQPTPQQLVTISDSIRIDKKAVVPPRRHRAQAHRPPQQAARPAVAQVAQAEQPAAPPEPVRQETVPAPPTPRPLPRHARHEMAKDDKKGRYQPPQTVAALTPLRRPTEPPATPPPTPEPTFAPATAPPERPAHPRVRIAKPVEITPPKTVALAPQPHPARPSRASAHLTPEQIAQIDGDLAKSIAQDRSEENPLRVPKTLASAPRRYHMSVDSVHAGSLRSGEGTYWALTDGRHGADGYDYYQCAYAYQWADGTFERGTVPWPVRFAPSEDPILHPELGRGGPIGLPPPPPGFQLAADMHVGRALRVYFPGVVFTDQ